MSKTVICVKCGKEHSIETGIQRDGSGLEKVTCACGEQIYPSPTDEGF